MGDIHFFGKVDKNKDGVIASQYPAWMMETHVEELKRAIEEKELKLANHMVEPEDMMYIKAELDREKKRLVDIESSKPTLSGEQKDKVYSNYKDLAGKIADSLFTRDEMMLGLANPHEEAHRMVDPIIPINPEIAEACGVESRDGKVSRNEATRIFKILGKVLGEETNVEALRRDSRRRK